MPTETVALYNKYRPRRFADLRGNPELVAGLTRALKDGKLPHAVLLTGPSGTGKTTVARILQRRLECHDNDYVEIDCPALDGVLETVRRVKSQQAGSPLGGKCRMFYWDECFPGCSLVNTSVGPRRIDQVQPGDKLLNAAGETSVNQVFQNRVALDRIVRLWFNDGSSLVTTKEHEILTERGWKTAASLDFDIAILGLPSYSKGLNRQHGGQDETNVRILSGGVRGEVPVEQSKVLFPILRPETKAEESGQRIHLDEEVPVVRKGLRRSGGPAVSPVQVLQPTMRRGFHYEQSEKSGSFDLPATKEVAGTGIHQLHQDSGTSRQDESPGGLSTHSGSGEKETRRVGTVQCHRRLQTVEETTVQEDGQEQPQRKPGNHSEGSEDQGTQRNLARVEGQTRRQRPDNPAAGISMGHVGRQGSRVGNGTSCKDDGQEIRLFHQLQGGHRQPEIETSHRGRWWGASVEERYNAGRQKDPATRVLRVVRIESYQRGRNESSFTGFLSPQEVHQGFATFYDLKINGHPSYFIDGVPVHNCQSLSRASFAQQGLLKMLEDCPSHVYHVLATTDPGKLIPTIRTRCTTYALRPLTDADMRELLVDTIEKEGLTGSGPDGSVLNKIVEHAGGSARKALVMLGKVLALETEEEQLVAVEAGDEERQAIELARMLMYGKARWADVAKLLKELAAEDPERLRHMILGYAAGVLLNGKADDRAMALIDAFRDHWYDCGGKAGLVAACYGMVKK